MFSDASGLGSDASEEEEEAKVVHACPRGASTTKPTWKKVAAVGTICYHSVDLSQPLWTMMAMTACSHNDSHLLNTLGLNGNCGDSMDVHNAIGGLSEKTCVDHLISIFSTIND